MPLDLKFSIGFMWKQINWTLNHKIWSGKKKLTKFTLGREMKERIQWVNRRSEWSDRSSERLVGKSNGFGRESLLRLWVCSFFLSLLLRSWTVELDSSFQKMVEPTWDYSSHTSTSDSDCGLPINGCDWISLFKLEDRLTPGLEFWALGLGPWRFLTLLCFVLRAKEQAKNSSLHLGKILN